jgi:hypothetical protein
MEIVLLVIGLQNLIISVLGLNFEFISEYTSQNLEIFEAEK